MIQNIIMLSLISFLIYIIGTSVLGRIFFAKKVSVYIRIALLGIFTTPLMWLFRNLLSVVNLEILFFDSIAHLSIGVLFAHFICLPDRALTLRILVEISDAPEGLALRELCSRFSLEEMVKSRLKQMEKSKILSVQNDEKIVLHKKGSLIGNLILKGRRFYNIKSAN